MTAYLDHNATTRVDDRVFEAMRPYLQDEYGNPSSVHRAGRYARTAIDGARQQVADLVGAPPSQVIFTSGGTEANNLALTGVVRARPDTILAYSAIEHSSVLETVHYLESQGSQCLEIAVQANGRVSTRSSQQALDKGAGLVSVMLVNNETGAVQPIHDIQQQAADANAILHVDAVQAAGKLPLQGLLSDVDLVSLSAHKLYGPKGIGALIIREGIELVPMMYGGGHERGLRAGTENVAAIVGFGMAAELAVSELETRRQHMQALQDRLLERLDAMPGITIFARDAERVVNTVQLGVAGIVGETLLLTLDQQGYAVSSGSACSSSSNEPSHVLMAMGIDRELSRNAIRVSTGKDTRMEEIDGFCDALQGQLDMLKRFSAVLER